MMLETDTRGTVGYGLPPSINFDAPIPVGPTNSGQLPPVQSFSPGNAAVLPTVGTPDTGPTPLNPIDANTLSGVTEPAPSYAMPIDVATLPTSPITDNNLPANPAMQTTGQIAPTTTQPATQALGGVSFQDLWNLYQSQFIPPAQAAQQSGYIFVPQQDQSQQASGGVSSLTVWAVILGVAGLVALLYFEWRKRR